MADLSTNYMDDILAESMNGKRKYRITRADGSFEEVTLEDISEYEQRGSVFGAGDINRTNQAVNEKFDSGDVVDPMETTVPGFAADALAVKNQFNEQNKKLVYSILDVISFEHTIYIGQAPDSNSFIIPYGVTYEKTPSSIIVELTSLHYATPIIMDKTNNQCTLAILKSAGNAGDITITGNLILIE